MKLRIKGNSIRLRLPRSEGIRVAMKGSLESQTDFGSRAFRFALLTRDGAVGPLASFGENSILLSAPRAAIAHWAQSEDLGLYGEQPTSEGDPLTIAVEKDFRCLDRSRADGDETDAYPHALVKCQNP